LKKDTADSLKNNREKRELQKPSVLPFFIFGGRKVKSLSGVVKSRLRCYINRPKK
jgi:hypothetical protein